MLSADAYLSESAQPNKQRIDRSTCQAHFFVETFVMKKEMQQFYSASNNLSRAVFNLYVNVSVLIKFSQNTSVFTLIIISSP